MTLVSFQLSMPGTPYWSGRWSGEERHHVVIRRLTNPIADKVLAKPNYSYSWTNGWRAVVTVEAVDAQKAARLRKVSDGFCGYNWMVQSITFFQEVVPPSEWKREFEKTKKV